MSGFRFIVYTLLSLVPPGFVTTYGSIARVTGLHPRVVGRILSENNDPVVVPCHRVVRSDGSLGGYKWGGPHVKKRLLELEGVEFDGPWRVSRRSIIDLAYILG